MTPVQKVEREPLQRLTPCTSDGPYDCWDGDRINILQHGVGEEWLIQVEHQETVHAVWDCHAVSVGVVKLKYCWHARVMGNVQSHFKCSCSRHVR